MDKVRYVKEVNGVIEEYFEIASFQIDYASKTIQTIISRLKMVSGFPEIRTYTYSLADVFDTSNIYQVDPNWNASSTPPKPEGFILEDPETWGGLSWEQIPKLIPNKNYYSDLFLYVNENPTTPAYLAIEKFILNSLILKGDLPEISDGWSFKTMTVTKIW